MTVRRVLLVAGVRLYREGIAHALANDGAFTIVGAHADVDRALVAARDALPDVVLLDAALPGSLAAVAAFAALAPAPFVVTFGMPETDREVLAFAEAGIAGYVGTDDTTERLLEVLHSVARGELLCSPRVAALMLRRLATLRGTRRASFPALTFREHEIVSLIGQGLSNKQIGARLSIELATVKNHVHRILEKLQVHRRAEAAARVRQRDGAPHERAERR